MPEKKEKKPEKQTAYIGLTILFFLFIAVVMVLVKFRLVQPVNLYVVSEPSDSLQTASEHASSSAEEVMAGAVKDILREALDIREESHASNLQEPESQGASAEKKININTASQSELETLPGIGPKLAERIVQYREEQGAFSEIEDIMAVKGIGEKKFKKLREYIVIS